MKGAEQLIALRSQGKAPHWVGVNANAWQVYGIDESGNPWVQIDPGSNLERMDLRCLVGLRVEVWAMDEAWRSKVVEACKSAGAEVYAFDPYNEEMIHG